jgi:hypothetical protein
MTAFFFYSINPNQHLKARRWEMPDIKLEA